MISRQAKISAVTVLCASFAISSLGCRNSGGRFDFTPKFALPKLNLHSFPCKQKGTAPTAPTCGCEACQREAGLLPALPHEFPVESPACNTCPASPTVSSGDHFSAFPTASGTVEPSKLDNNPQPREQIGPYEFEEGSLGLPVSPPPTPTPAPAPVPAPANEKELFIVPEDGQFKPQTNENFQMTSPEPSLRKTVTSPVKKALTSIGEVQPKSNLNLNDFKPVDMVLGPKANELKAQIESAKSDLQMDVQKAQTDLANELAPLTLPSPPALEPAIEAPVPAPVTKPEPAIETPAPAPVVEPGLAAAPPEPAMELPAPMTAPAPAPVAEPELAAAPPEPAMELPAPMTAPAPAPAPVAEPELAAAPPKPAMELPAPPRFEAEAVEEIYGAILFDKRIEENLQKDHLGSGTALNVPVEIESPKRKVETTPPATIEIKRKPAEQQQVIHIRRQAEPQSDPVVLQAFSAQRSVNRTLRSSTVPVTQVSTGRASTPVTTPPKASGDFIIKSLPAPPAEQADADEYEFRSVPSFQIPVLRATLPANGQQSRFQIRPADSAGHSNSGYCESCATKLHEGAGQIKAPAEGKTQQNQQSEPRQQSQFFEREANNSLGYPTVR